MLITALPKLAMRQAARWAKACLRKPPLILMYHSVADVSSDPEGLVVSPRHFAEHLDVLRRYAHPLPLRQMAGDRVGKALPSRSVIVTFDDGYANNLHHAKPLLERYEVPATVFVTSGYLDKETESWWDEIERIFLQPGSLPDELRVNVNGTSYGWNLGKDAQYSDISQQAHSAWRSHEEPPTVRHQIYRSILELLRPLPDAARQRLRDDLLQWAGAITPARQTHRFLSTNELMELAKGGLIEIGSHTLTHPTLASLSRAEQNDEIFRSKLELETTIERPVRSFAYPFGRHQHYTSETVTLVRDAGYACACSTIPGHVAKDANPFELPRRYVPDWSGEEFSRSLSLWFGG